MQQINIERLKSEILELGEIGKNDEDKGLYRMAFTDADIESRNWLMKRITDNGLNAYVVGRWFIRVDSRKFVAKKNSCSSGSSVAKKIRNPNSAFA